MRRIVIVLLLVAAFGCASAPRQAPERQPTSVAASFGQTWDAAIDIFAAHNIPIKTLDRSSGLIVAEQSRVGPSDVAKFADCGKRLMAVVTAGVTGDVGPARADYNVLVRGDSTRATVRVTAHFTEHSGRRCTTRGVFESEVEAAVKSGAESP